MIFDIATLFVNKQFKDWVCASMTSDYVNSREISLKESDQRTFADIATLMGGTLVDIIYAGNSIRIESIIIEIEEETLSMFLLGLE